MLYSRYSDLGQNPLKEGTTETNRRDFLKTAGTAVVAGETGVLINNEALAGAGMGAGGKISPGYPPMAMPEGVILGMPPEM